MPEHVELLSELLQRCRQHDANAMQRLVHRFYNYALSLAVALVDDRNDGQDVVQETMLTMLTQLHQLRDPQAFPGWLRQIVRSHANRSRRRGPLQRGLGEQHNPPSPEELAELVELRQQVRRALSSLPAASQQTAHLFYLDELDQTQIAQQLDVPLGTVKRRLHDARVKLRKLLWDDSQPPPNLPL
jgi:RNA polymerase sigma-70 factor (ECF subfamily)